MKPNNYSQYCIRNVSAHLQKAIPAERFAIAPPKFSLSKRSPPHPQKSDSYGALRYRTSPHLLKAIALPHPQKAIPAERFAIALPHPKKRFLGRASLSQYVTLEVRKGSKERNQ